MKEGQKFRDYLKVQVILFIIVFGIWWLTARMYEYLDAEMRLHVLTVTYFAWAGIAAIITLRRFKTWLAIILIAVALFFGTNGSMNPFEGGHGFF